MKKWNWTMFWVVFVICAVGIFANPNYHTWQECLIIGITGGLIFGLLSAVVFKD